MSTITGDARVRELVSLETQQLAPDELFVGAHVVLDGRLGVDDAARAIDEISDAVRDQVPAARVVYVEPEAGSGDAQALRRDDCGP